MNSGKHILGVVVIMTIATVLSTTQSVYSQNTLSKKEQKKGWTLLFDGKSTAGWHAYNGKETGAAWKVQDGALTLDTSDKNAAGGDIVTDTEYQNFELQIDWKIEPCGNSGIMINVVETPANQYTYYTGPEIQVLDNCHPDGKIAKHRAGNLYDLISSKKESAKPGGEWNHYKIVSDNGKLTAWLNDVEQFSVQMFTPEWEALIKGSKFKGMPDFGKALKGRIALQDHGNQVWYRNIKIRVPEK